MRIATWNVNSIKARLDHVLAWLADADVDILLLQELKMETAAFPAMTFVEAGYRAHVVGQKSYNGVALLHRIPAELRLTALPGDADDAQARYVEALVDDVVIGGLYLPNGNPVSDPAKFDYKIAWLGRLKDHVEALLEEGRPFLLGGDFNVIPFAADAYDATAWADDALYRPESRQAFQALLNLGLTDAFRAIDQNPGRYTFWDYQAGRWQNDEGMRIDHFLLSPGAADRLTDCRIDKGPRAKPKASDHTPVILDLA